MESSKRFSFSTGNPRYSIYVPLRLWLEIRTEVHTILENASLYGTVTGVIQQYCLEANWNVRHSASDIPHWILNRVRDDVGIAERTV